MQATGRDPEAEPILRTIIASVPNDPNARLSLGLWLVRNGQSADALAELTAAAELGEQNPRFAYVYAVATADSGRPADAIAILEDSLERHPYDRDSLIALAVYKRQAGNLEDALAHAELLLNLEPDDASIRDFVAQLRR
jgi:Flp pilus assembly protein TadD